MARELSAQFLLEGFDLPGELRSQPFLALLDARQERSGPDVEFAVMPLVHLGVLGEGLGVLGEGLGVLGEGLVLLRDLLGVLREDLAMLREGLGLRREYLEGFAVPLLETRESMMKWSELLSQLA